MRTYQISKSELDVMREKISAAQTLLNANCVAIAEGRQPLSAETRLDLAEDAEELVNDVGDIISAISVRG